MQHKDEKQEILVWKPKKTVKDVKKIKWWEKKMGNENITALDKTHYQETQQERLR